MITKREKDQQINRRFHELLEQRYTIMQATTVVVTQYEYIEKQLGKWDSFILRFGNWMFGALGCTVICLIVIFIFKIKKWVSQK